MFIVLSKISNDMLLYILFFFNLSNQNCFIQYKTAGEIGLLVFFLIKYRFDLARQKTHACFGSKFHRLLYLRLKHI